MTKKEVTELSYKMVGIAIKVHKALGPGLLESVYQKCMKYELIKQGYLVEENKIVPLMYDEIEIQAELRLDLIVNDLIIIELKTVENLLPVHEAQLLTYMNLLNKPQGLLINFYSENITKTCKPMINKYFQKLKDN